MCKYKARLLPLFKQQFLVFKQHYFYTLILPRMFPKKKKMLLVECLDLCLCLCVCTFFFFFKVLRNSNRYCSCTVRRQSYCSRIIYTVHTLFTGPTITSFKKIYIKNGPHKTIYNCFQFSSK